jgi:hypothetical protein
MGTTSDVSLLTFYDKLDESSSFLLQLKKSKDMKDGLKLFSSDTEPNLFFMREEMRVTKEEELKAQQSILIFSF